MVSRPVPLGSVLAAVGAISLSACSQASPVAPAPLTAVAPQIAAASAEGPGPVANAAGSLKAVESLKVGNTFEVRIGTFALTFPEGSLTGDYSGVVVARGSNVPRGSFQLVVTGGSGSFTGAEGSITGSATGALLGEGSFELSFRGTVSTDLSDKLDVRGSLEGVSAISCGASELIHITMTGTGTGRGLGAVSALFNHDLSNTGCS